MHNKEVKIETVEVPVEVIREVHVEVDKIVHVDKIVEVEVEKIVYQKSHED